MAAFLLMPCGMVRTLQLDEGFRRICCRMEFLENVHYTAYLHSLFVNWTFYHMHICVGRTRA